MVSAIYRIYLTRSTIIGGGIVMLAKWVEPQDAQR
jgi:hypothetical protein